MLKKWFGIAATVLTTAAAAVIPGILAAPEASAQVCPALTVVAARGSGENYGANWAPQVYGPSPWVSNGREGPTLAGMFHYIESWYNQTYGGSVMNSVFVLGLDEYKYPAMAPDRDIKPPTNIEEGINIARELILPQAALFRDSFINGTHGILAAIDEYEAWSGCHPQYVLAGYSQGAVVTHGVERELARQGRLAGTINLGSPYTSKGDPHRIGTGLTGDGILAWTPLGSGKLSGVDRIEYCVADDPFCDMNPGKYIDRLPVDYLAHGSYFRWNSSQWQDRAAVAQRFSSWVDARR
ncbi:MAG: hypothetical protein SPI77_00910 [Corynebacterium sp.]|nr:hypothetical protein [Corynebacterium sp.]